MAKKKKIPPSRIKYEEANPVVSARVDRELYEKLNETREKTGKSYADILKEGLGVQEPTTKKAYDRGYKAGFKEGKKEGIREGEQFSIGRCKICGEPLLFDLSMDNHRQYLEKVIKDGGTRHIDCEGSS